MMRVLPFLAVGLTLMGLAAQASAQRTQEVPAALRRAIETASTLRYTGTRVIVFRRDGQTNQHTEIVIRDGSRMRIEFPSGSPFAGQVIVENDRERQHFFPDKNEIHVQPPRRESTVLRLERMVREPDRFRLASREGEVVAGIATDQVVVMDPDGNVMQRLFIDPRSGVLLKRQMYDRVGTEVGSFHFTRIELNPRISPRVFEIRRRGAKTIRPIDTLRSTARENNLLFAHLSPQTGYHLTHSRLMKVEGNDVLVQFYTADDRRLSLYQVKADVSRDRLAQFARGQMQFYSWASRGYTFVLVGSQDQPTLQRIARQIVYGT